MVKQDKQKNNKQIPIVLILLIGVLLGFVVSCIGMIIKSLTPETPKPDVRLSDEPIPMTYQQSERLSSAKTVGNIAFDIPDNTERYENCAVFMLDDMVVTVEPSEQSMEAYSQLLMTRYFGDVASDIQPYHFKSGSLNGFRAECSLYSFAYREHTVYTATYCLYTDGEKAVYVSVYGKENNYDTLIELACEVIHTAQNASAIEAPQVSVTPTVTPSPAPTVEEIPEETETVSENEEVDHTPVTYNSIGEVDFEVIENAYYETMLVVFQYECSNITPVECYMQSPDKKRTYQPVSMNIGNSGEIIFEIPYPESGIWQIHYRTNSEYLGYVYVYSYEKAQYEYMQDEDNRPARGYAEDELNDGTE